MAKQKGRQIYLTAEEINWIASQCELQDVSADDNIRMAKDSRRWASSSDMEKQCDEDIAYHEEQKKMIAKLDKKMFYYG